MIASLAVLVSLASPTAADSVKIENFRSGLACTHTTQVAGRNGWICQQTDLVLVTDQGLCNFDGQDKRCTWFGFEFDYVAPKPGTKIQCEAATSVPSSEGNSSGIRTRHSKTSKYELELPAVAGHFFNPQYWIFNLQSAEDDDVLYETVCRHQGRVNRPGFPGGSNS